LKHYPSIDARVSDVAVHVFDKLDGSNIRAEWSRKRKEFYKFGSRKQLIDASDRTLGEAIMLIRRKYEQDLTQRFMGMRWESVICFFEFFGPSSFAGQHVDEQHDVVLLDVAPYKRGIIPPPELVKLADGLEIPRLLHLGRLSDEDVRAIRASSMPGITFEGVVCKPTDGKSGMFKIKTSAWLSKLRTKCGDNETLFKELA
jgi:hypothetical protein